MVIKEMKTLNLRLKKFTIKFAMQSQAQFKELRAFGLKTLSTRRWLRELTYFHEALNGLTTTYFFELIPSNNNSYKTKTHSNSVVTKFFIKTEKFFFSMIY